MPIDMTLTARFLGALAGAQPSTFQTFSEARSGTKRLTRVLHGTFEQHAATLQTLNLKGAGAFVMVNNGNLQGRKASDVTNVRALFVDLDGAPVEPVLNCSLPPRIVVESSPGRWHCYWPVLDMPLGLFKDAQKELALRFAGDPKVCDLPRVMRLPGFLHNKREPYLTGLVKCDAGPLPWSELAHALGLRGRMCLPESIPKGERNTALYRLAASAAKKGVPEAEQREKALQVNASRCQPPLHPAEVTQVVASAYSRPLQGSAAIPLAVLDGEAYRALDDASRTLLLFAYRRADRFGDFTLPHSELKAWFRRKDTFHAIRKRLVASGLLNVTREPAVAMPRLQRGPKPTFYRLAIGPFAVAYSRREIGSSGVAPEALHARGFEASSSEGVAAERHVV